MGEGWRGQSHSQGHTPRDQTPFLKTASSERLHLPLASRQEPPNAPYSRASPRSSWAGALFFGLPRSAHSWIPSGFSTQLDPSNQPQFLLFPTPVTAAHLCSHGSTPKGHVCGVSLLCCQATQMIPISLSSRGTRAGQI